MSTITEEILCGIMTGASPQRRAEALPVLNSVAAAYDVTNRQRVAAWLATVAVESGQLRYQEEIASGAAYEGRLDLGNTQKGDGVRFKGRGRIQITGRFNYQSYTDYLKANAHLPYIDFMQDPPALAAEPYATDSAGWFFAIKIKANPLADKGLFLDIQVKVNGRNKKTGLPNNWTERNAFYQRGLSLLPADFQLDAPQASPVPESTPAAPPKPSPAPPKPAPAPQNKPATVPVSAAGGPRVLVQGDKGDDVKAMQQRLIHYKFLVAGGADGIFGPMTKKAVVKLQTDHHITVDGEVGPQTRKILFD